MTEGASNGGNHKFAEHDLIWKTAKWVLIELRASLALAERYGQPGLVPVASAWNTTYSQEKVPQLNSTFSPCSSSNIIYIVFHLSSALPCIPGELHTALALWTLRTWNIIIFTG